MSDHTCTVAQTGSKYKSKDLFLLYHMINLFMPGLLTVCDQNHGRQVSAGLNQYCPRLSLNHNFNCPLLLHAAIRYQARLKEQD